jgi:hypothetical protein
MSDFKLLAPENWQNGGPSKGDRIHAFLVSVTRRGKTMDASWRRDSDGRFVFTPTEETFSRIMCADVLAACWPDRELDEVLPPDPVEVEAEAAKLKPAPVAPVVDLDAERRRMIMRARAADSADRQDRRRR